MRVLHDWLLTPERVAVHWPTRTAVAADLHLGYAEARRRRGEAVPVEPLSELLEPLRRVQQQHALRNLIVAGDLLEDGDCHETLTAFLKWLDQHRLHLSAVIPGNHDNGLERYPYLSHPQKWEREGRGLPLRPEGMALGCWHIAHGEGPLPNAPVVHGHDHPCLRWSPKNRAIRPRTLQDRIAQNALDAPCYLTGPQRLILPAFSKEAAGVSILSVRRWRGFRCLPIAENRVLDFGEVATLRSRLSAACRSTFDRTTGRVDQ